jgi:two-component system OmpR family sensor kinase
MTTEGAQWISRTLPAYRFGVRVRIMATVLVLTALGMILAGGAFALFERRQLIGHLDSELIAEARAFEETARSLEGPGSSVASVLRTALRRPAPADEVLLGMIDGRAAFVTEGARPLAIEQETSLLAEIAALPPDTPTRLRQSKASVGQVRYVAVQLQVAGRPERGVYVAVAALGPAQALLAESAREYGLLSVAVLAVVASGGWAVSGRLLRPLRRLRRTVERISHTDLTARIPVTGRDDVTELTRTFNDMLGRLESAFDAQQEFLDDAGHELRTPLTIIRGHLEVCDLNDPGEVAATRALVVDELDRMARLVGDLIVLAQARRPDFVRYEPVDLDSLLHAVCDKAGALADRQWLLDGKAGVVVLADEQRLTQAMLQLADNAARHTQPGDVVAFGGAVTRDCVLLWVRDTGTGVDPADAERIFERFGRARSERGRDGSGLGLSIVAGIAVAHQGRVTLEPQHLAGTDGEGGACFTLRLPLAVLTGAAPHRTPERGWASTPSSGPAPVHGPVVPGPAVSSASGRLAVRGRRPGWPRTAGNSRTRVPGAARTSRSGPASQRKGWS